MSKNLFADDSGGSDDDLTIKTNKDYAKSFNRLREKELYKKLKEQDLNSGSDSDSSSESDSSDEDEVNNPKFDEEFFKTLASLKSRDPSIYDKEKKFFVDVDEYASKVTEGSKSKKPLTLKDYERKVILEKGGKYEDDDSDQEENDYDDRPQSPTYVEEQRQLRNEFKQVLNEDESDEEFGGIFKKRVKTNEEKTREEEEFTKWLAGKKDDSEVQENVKTSLAPLKEYWSKPNLTQPEKFLRDYILNKGYTDAHLDEIPTYEEIVGDGNLSEDEQELEKQAEFEQKFNFRFEEPDQDFIKRYPRTIDNSVRQKDEKRKQKRLETKERKDREKQQKMQDLDMLKELKRKEIEEKIKKLKEVTGNEELAFETNELDDDFDPAAHDRRMQQIFNDEYYGIDEGEEKPECPDFDELKIEDWDNFDPRGGDAHGDGGEEFEAHCEDDDFNMDCDYNPIKAKEDLQQELIENTLDNRKRRKRRNRFMEMIKTDKPAFDPEDEKTYGEYIEEYYKMDCEDMIGDTPCRFKYVETAPNDFGLTIEEILLAKNKELNQWASLKKAIQIRPDYLEKKEQRLYKMKANNEELKKKIFKSLYGPSSDEDDEEEVQRNQQQPQPGTSKKKKNKRTKPSETVTSENNTKTIKFEEPDEEKSDVTSAVDATIKADESPTANTNGKKKNKKKKKKNANTGSEVKATEIKSKSTDTDPKNTTNKDLNTKKKNNNNPFSKGENTSYGNNFPKNNKFNQNSDNKKFKNGKINKNNKNDDRGVKLSDERLKAYGINPRKFHNTQKYGKKD